MGPSTWPETEISPRNEDTLLQAARLRPFGVNYLQGAICPYLGLLAHLDGTSVHLFPFPPGDENTGQPLDACIASIDLSAATRASNADGGGRRGVPQGGEKEGGLSQVGVPRSLSWTQCNGPAAIAGPVPRKPGDVSRMSPDGHRPPVDASGAAAVAVPAAVVAVASTKLGGSDSDRGSHVKEDVGWDGASRAAVGAEYVGDGGGGKVSAHLAVACGAEVRLWEVSRFSARRGRAGEGGRGEKNESAADRQYRYSAAEVLTNWHRTTGNDCGGGDAVVASAGKNRRKDGRDGSVDETKDCRDGSDDEKIAASRGGGGTQPRGKGFSTSANNVRCMSFRPGCGGEDARKPEREHGEEGAPPLAVWYDTEAAVLGPGNNRATFPAPVAKKRACGAWSGCGRYLATSSGGEIRVHINPSGKKKHTLEAMGHVDAGLDNASSAEQPSRAVEAWAGTDSTTTHADGVLATDDNEGTSAPWAKVVTESGTSESGGEFGGNSFRTVLCVEAALCDGGGGGGGLSSPGSSAGGSSTPSPKSTPSRRRVPPGGRHGLNDLTPPPSFAHMPSSAHKSGDTDRRSHLSSNAEHRDNLSSNTDGRSSLSSHTERRDNLSSHTERRDNNLSSKPSAASSKVLMGDMRAMCPAGPSAFFGTTDGGLGVGSLFGGGNSLGGSFAAASATSGGRGGQDLLGAVVSDSVARIAAASDAATDAALSFRDYSSPTQNSIDGGDGAGQEEGDKHTRRGGFRHVLPGENWLAGSLRPRSRAPPTHSLKKMSHSSDPLSSTPPSVYEQVSRKAVGEANKIASAAGEDHTAAGNALDGRLLSAVRTVEADNTAAANALDGGLLSGAPNSSLACTLPLSASAPEVLDLRGKIGGVHSGVGGSGAAGSGVVSTHPLFRLSLDGGIDPTSSGSTATPKTDDVHSRHAGVRGVTGATGVSESVGDTAGVPSRRPWLMRVSCSSSSSRTADANDSKGAPKDGVRVKTLAALPLELASPDLLASSDDGNIVAVGSHASGLVACYRLSVRPVAGQRPASSPPSVRERESEINSARSIGAEGVGVGSAAGSLAGATGGGGGRRRRQKKRLAVPLCTLRLPSGYRAKGLTLVKDGGEEGIGDREIQRRKDAENVGVSTRAGVVIGESGGTGSTMSAADGASRGEGVAVLVLAGCPVADPTAVAHPRQGATATKSLPLGSSSFGKKSASELSYRTVLLRFALPEFAVGGSSDDKKRPPSFSPRAGTNESFSPRAGTDEHRCTREASGMASMVASQRNKDEPAHVRLGSSDCPSGHGGRAGGGSEARTITDVVGRDAVSVPEDTRPSYDKVFDDDGGGGGGIESNTIGTQRGPRFEAAVLEGLAGLERRLGERLDRIERLTLGMCDRVGALERALDGLSRNDTGETRDG